MNAQKHSESIKTLNIGRTAVAFEARTGKTICSDSDSPRGNREKFLFEGRTKIPASPPANGWRLEEDGEEDRQEGDRRNYLRSGDLHPE